MIPFGYKKGVSEVFNLSLYDSICYEETPKTVAPNIYLTTATIRTIDANYPEFKLNRNPDELI